MTRQTKGGITRKEFLRYGAGGLAAAALGAPFATRARAAEALTVSWWGEGDQNARTSAAIEAYGKENGVTFSTQPANFSAYFERLATQVAGGNPPDVFQLYLPILAEYASRGTLVKLDDYIGSTIDTSGWSQPAKDGLYYDDTAYFVPLGLSSQPAIIIDKTVLDEVGVGEIDPNWTLDQFREIAGQIAAALKKKNDGPGFGTADLSGQPIVMEAFIRSKGMDVFTEDGKLGFQPDDLKEFFTFWDEMRQEGSVVPPEYGGGGFDSSPIIKGYAPMVVAYSSKGIQGYQSLTDHDLNFAPLPRYSSETERTELVAPVEWMSISSKCPDPDAAAALLNFLTNDPKAIQAMGIAHGVPVSAEMRKQQMESGNLSDVEMKIYKNAEEALPFSRPRVVFPVGASKLMQGGTGVLPQVAEQIAYGRMSIDAAVDRFFAEAHRALR